MKDVDPMDIPLGKSDQKAIWGKNAPPQGQSVAIALIDPRYSHNVGGALRAASNFGAKQVWWTGNRVNLDEEKGERLPREERMKGYKDVELYQYDEFFDQFPSDITPVAVERRPNSENLLDFVHPEKALYVFGPEDGSIGAVHLRHCHRFVIIPTAHCLNLAAAVNVVLYDRMLKEMRGGR